MEDERPVDVEAKMRLCASLGHANLFVVPIEVRPPAPRDVNRYQVRIVCQVCGERGWMGLTPTQWDVLKQDFAKGRVG